MSLEKPSFDPSARKTFSIRAIAFTALGLVVGAGGMLLFRNPAASAVSQVAAKKQMYQCPMHPQIIQDHAGTCPICGMDLVPMEGGALAHPGEHGKEGTGTDTHAAVVIDHERQQLIGLRTEKAVEGEVGGELRTVGRVVVDETRVRKVNVKVEGFVEKLFVDFVGKPVAKGQPLFSLYSPDFVSAQREFLLAQKTQKALAGGSLQGSGGELLEAARRRLQLWDVPQEALDRLEKTGEVQRALTLRSPISGVVTAKNVVEGARITSADIPLEITDLGHVWVQADIYEAELGRVKVGMPAELTVASSAGKTFKGRVAFIDPSMDPKTRTARARLEFANPHGELKPEMFGDVRLMAQGRKGLIVPLDAVLDAGTTKVVFVSLGEGRFEPRAVSTGTGLGEKVEIRSGLRAGEEVVVRANFLVDSESRLKAALAHLSRQAGPSTPTPAPAGEHRH
ncbi:efflux RND transporter periplasmic adaptor subunit [Geothrix sp. PMB-07]|uniref:efflux RND transporter periplasmic adaptor subunit n=1 Tax=Geothrix sp. PMB-07 TaxID=3068640 RepID=UPI0027425BC5|nr:efflux RND transporter periplasmic adaptor subunit [Geothrix sp. PMB-07]WLT30509.1 efflux RND transporter periplasmic adaptor subunit [Geothrix sp. PMB-07]